MTSIYDQFREKDNEQNVLELAPSQNIKEDKTPVFNQYDEFRKQDKETARNVAAVQTMKEAGVSSEQLPDSVVNALTKDYSALMKHDKMKSKR